MLPKLHYLFLIVLHVISISLGYSQSNYYKNFNVRNGLPSSETYSVFQDSKGYIWIAGDAGVSKYNGHQFENFTTAEGLGDNTIFNFYEDKKERIWFLSYSINLSYYEKGEIKKIFPNGELGRFIGNEYISSICIDSLDNLWIATDKGFYSLNLKNEKFECTAVNIPEGYFIKEIEDNFLFGKNDTSITTAITFTVDLKDKLFDKKLYNKNFSKVNLGFTINSQRHILFHNFHALISCNLKTEEINSQFSSSRTISVYADKKDRFWVGTLKDGVYLFEDDPVTSRFRKQFLRGKSITKVLQDHEGNFWFSTIEDGVYYVSENQVLNILENNKTVKEAKIATFNDSLVYGVLTELEAFRANEGLFEKVGFENKNLPGTPTTIFIDSKSRVWFGITMGSFIYYPETDRKLKNPYKVADWVAITEDKQGAIWMASYSYLFKINNSDLKISNIIPLSKRPFALKAGPNNEIYIGALDGLWKYENDILTYLGNQHPFLKHRIDDILILKDKSIVLATKGAGIGIWKNGKIRTINTSNGLESNICKTLALDKEENIWVGTNHGLSRLVNVNDNWVINSFAKRHGLIDNEISSIVFCNNKLWIASNVGISYYNIEELLEKETITPVIIKQISTIDSNYIPGKKPLELSYKDNFISIEFEALTYIDPDNTKFLYRLSGLHSEWRVTTNRTVQFSYLKAGKYLFEVAPFINGADTINSSAKISFYVVPPFWDLWWFKTLIALLVSSIIIYTIIYLNNRYRQKINTNYEYKKRIADIELRALRSQLNPHFIFNCMGTVQNLILKNKNEAAETYISKFSKLLRTVLASSSENVISLDQELETIKSYLDLESLRFAKGFNYKIEIEKGINTSEIDIPPMLIQPFVENAIWHGLIHKEGDKNLDIVVSRNADYTVCLTISDNGIGRQKSQQLNQDLEKFKSYGINLCNDRIILSNSYSEKKIILSINDLKDSQNKTSGTIVKILITQ
ncbi:MAG: histidine kinase [Bacteroidota bacterium]|nr:histidine kinase [Bacteroidota bacterium]